MLLLLPPSEGKSEPASDAAPMDRDALAFAAALDRTRGKVLRAAGLGRLRNAPAAPAAEVYTGVLYGRLGLTDLQASAEQLLIFSGLWGMLAAEDRIPHYKLPVATTLPKLGAGLAATWRPALAKALAHRDTEDEVAVDLRSGGYVAMWRPAAATLLSVRSFRVNPDGSRQVISHNAKVARGDVARAVLTSRKALRTVEDVAGAAVAAGLEVELGGAGIARTLDVLEHS